MYLNTSTKVLRPILDCCTGRCINNAYDFMHNSCTGSSPGLLSLHPHNEPETNTKGKNGAQMIPQSVDHYNCSSLSGKKWPMALVYSRGGTCTVKIAKSASSYTAPLFGLRPGFRMCLRHAWDMSQTLEAHMETRPKDTL